MNTSSSLREAKRRKIILNWSILFCCAWSSRVVSALGEEMCFFSFDADAADNVAFLDRCCISKPVYLPFVRLAIPKNLTLLSCGVTCLCVLF